LVRAVRCRYALTQYRHSGSILRCVTCELRASAVVVGFYHERVWIWQRGIDKRELIFCWDQAARPDFVTGGESRYAVIAELKALDFVVVSSWACEIWQASELAQAELVYFGQ